MNETIASVTANMDKYEFALVGNELYSFIWDDFCSWYIELSKAGLNSEDAQVKRATQSTLIVCLRAIIRLLHPFMPFVTEEIYSVLPHTEKACCLAAWPTPVEGLDLSHNEEVDQLISVIKTIRQVRVVTI